MYLACMVGMAFVVYLERSMQLRMEELLIFLLNFFFVPRCYAYVIRIENEL